MGKAEDEHSLPSTTLGAQGTTQRAAPRRGCFFSCTKLKKVVTLRCVLILVLGVAVFLSAVFWLPILHFGNKKDLDLDYPGHDIVASFMLRRPASFLQDYKTQLEDGIFEEMSYASAKVEIISLESSSSSPGSNMTKVVFAVEGDATTQSLIKSLFVDLITRRTYLQLTASLFGEPFSFDVLKFKGGITANPDQKAFLLQNDKILFNFTLHFSIDLILNNFNELRSQLSTGLHLTPYENLYIRLTNLKGSTVAPPTTVQSQVLLAVGIDPSKRLKQLAQTVSAHTENLGLNDTVFGKVKQVRLSTMLQHSLNNNGHGPSSSPSPSPLPSPYSSPENHHHHHRRSHHHHHTAEGPTTPTVSPSPSIASHGPAHQKKTHVSTPAYAPSPGNNKALAPPPCPFGYKHRSPWKHSHLVPSKQPPLHAPISAPSQQPKRVKPRTTAKFPHAPVPSPLPSVSNYHGRPPSKGESHSGQVLPMVSPSYPTSSARILSLNAWALSLLLLTVLLVL